MSADSDLLKRLREVLAASDVEVEDLLRASWADAHDRVRAALTDVFTEELLQRSLRALRPHTPPRDGDESVMDQPSPPDPTSTQRALATYLFGVVEPRARAPEDGTPRLPGGGPPRVLAGTHCAAIVADVDPTVFDGLHETGSEGLDLLAEAARAHDEILARVAAAGPVLPLRLGTVLPDDGAVVSLLDRNAQSLTAELDRLTAHAEWAVTVQVLEDIGDSGGADHRTATSGRDYLEQRQRSLRERDSKWEHEEDLAAAVHAPLALQAVDAIRIERRPFQDAAPPLLHGVYLVRDDDFERFQDALTAARDAHPQAVIELSGPWPAYHFSDLDLSDESEERRS